jgi:Zn-finger in ubiquitin-hydrolases and other protein
MGENWMCLRCGGIYCSRYVNGHGLQHWQDSMVNDQQRRTEPRGLLLGVGGSEEDVKECRGGDGNDGNVDEHCVMVSLADLSVWCHRCAAYLRHESLKPVLQRLEELKFKDDN